MGEKVNHPSHYNRSGRKECIVELREQFGRITVYGFDNGNAFKYLYRAGEKEGNSASQDIAKASWYRVNAADIYSSWNWFQKLVFKLAQAICW